MFTGRQTRPHPVCNTLGSRHRRAYCKLASSRQQHTRSDTPRNLGITNRLTNADLAQRLPHTLLEGGAADVERQIEADPRRLDNADNPRD